MGLSLSPLAAASSVLGKRSRLTDSSPSASERSDLRVVERLVRPLLGFGAHCRQIDLNVYGGERCCYHEDNEQHEHHVDERRDVDLMDLAQRIIAMVETHDGPLVPTRVLLTQRPTMRRGRARRRGDRDRG